MSSVKRYRYDLDSKPSDRWTPIINDFKDKIPMLRTEIDKLLVSMSVSPTILFCIRQLMKLYKSNIFYYDELCCLSELLDIPLEKILLLQLSYECNAMCTSVVTKVNGKFMHYRTMDWELPFLKDITIELEYIKNNKSIGLVTTWVGYVGVLTAISPNKYSISVNFRITGERGLLKFLGNVKSTLQLKWPVGHMVRHILENEYDYDTMVKFIKETQLISPTYLTIAGETNKPRIIIREPSEVVSDKSSDFTVQANMDSIDSDPRYDILDSKGRIAFANKVITDNNNNFTSSDVLFESFNKDPVINVETIYISLLDPNNYTLKTMLS
jgi:hypothetical protein